MAASSSGAKEAELSAPAAAAASKSSSSGNIIFPEMTFAHENVRTGFISLFQNGSKDVEGVRKLSGLYPTTPVQMIMSGINDEDRDISSEEWRRIFGEDGELAERESINLPSFLAETSNPGEKEKRMKNFKRYYSWLSSVVMPREDREGQMVLVSNEDEHVLAYGFMLTFGGGLGKPPSQKTASAAHSTRTIDQNDLLDFIGKYRADPQFFINMLSDQTACDLLRAIGYNDSGILEFAKNTFLLNYHGMFFSEQVANQVKSNMLFIKLQIIDDKPKFSPSDHRIDEFCKMMNIYKQSINVVFIRRLKEEIAAAKEPELEAEQSEKKIYYNKAHYTDKFFLGGWQNVAEHYSKENAEATMKYILNQLCVELNKHTIHRLFFNIVMNKIYLERYRKNNKDKAMSMRAFQANQNNPQKTRPSDALKQGSSNFAAAAAQGGPSSPLASARIGKPDSVRRPKRRARASDSAGASKDSDSAGASKDSLNTPDDDFIRAYVASLDRRKIESNEELSELLTPFFPTAEPVAKKPRTGKAKPRTGKAKARTGGKRKKKTKRRRKKKKKTRRQR